MPVIEISQPIRLAAPAKLNLGLEVLGRRPDGYHDLVTILQAVSLADQLDLTPAPALRYAPPRGIDRDADLVWRALRLAADEFALELRGEIRLVKRIPVAAGLGGGSSDAGTILGALARLAGIPLDTIEQASASLGSDVPFFVRGGAALATGTGTTLKRLSPLRDQRFVVVVPHLSIPNKTAALYQSLTPADYSDGRPTSEQAERLGRGEPLKSCLLRSSFERTLLDHPEVRAAADALRAAGAPVVLPSGSGPALFTVVESQDAAAGIAAAVRRPDAEVITCAPIGPVSAIPE